MRLLFLSLFFLLMISSDAFAVQRKWKNKDGSKSFSAEYLSQNKNSVSLKREDGKTVTLLLNEIHPDDQAYLKNIDTNGNHVSDKQAADDASLFDNLKFGETRENVQKKLQVSSMVEQAVADTYLGRFGLNGAFSTKQTIGGMKCYLYFDWSNDGLLREINLQTQPQQEQDYQPKLKPVALELEKVMTILYGKPNLLGNFPESNTVQNGISLSTRLWNVSKNGIGLLGVSKTNEGFIVLVRFTTEKIKLSAFDN
jgi:hypothetical protein